MRLLFDVNVMVVNKSRNPMPEYATEGSAGVDLRADLDSPMIVRPMERVLVPTGLYMSIPLGYEGQIRPRSGLAIKHGISLINCVGTLDSDYRGEVKIPIINLGEKSFVIENGERIAQLVLSPIEQIKWIITDQLEDTERGEGGFGHTGKE